jgi:uncharacterized protein YigA (DUF484 family)
MDNVLELKKKNEEIAKKFGHIEEKLSSVENPVHLFEEWQAGMSDAFGIPFLWISIIDNPENAAIIKAMKGSRLLKDRVNVIEESTFAGLTPNGVKPVLVNGELRPFFRLLPKNKYFIKSMALAPITMDGRVIGSLNHGDPSSKRYEPDMDTDLLQSLAAKLSSCLSAMTNHAPLSCP